MRRVLLVTAAFPALAFASAGPPAGVAPVSVSSRGFDPSTISIRAGDTVTWTNTGTLSQQVASDTGAFPPSPVLQPNQSWSFTFRRQGRFPYHDELHKSLKATVAVAPPPPSVTVGSARTSVVYGGTGLRLSGRVSSHRAGESVQIIARACGTFGSSQEDVITGTGGFWRLAVVPFRTTAFGASWNGVASQTFTVRVAPRIRLARVPAGFVASVQASSSLAKRIVQLQRWNGTRRTWAVLHSARLRAAGQTPSGTVFSTATFKKRSGRVRVLLTTAQAAPCYGQSASNALRVR